ncbi:MAG: amino acid adenylation domain-containing protein [Chloroflexi bacterium]|nr:amino acid adenylation domain-containing protein [Chloroflexota bacterium]
MTVELVKETSPNGHLTAHTLPLSTTQERLWFLHQLEPNNPAQHITAAFRLSGALRPMALEQSLNEVVKSHAPLRALFKAVDGHPQQTLMPLVYLKIPVVPVSDEAEARQLTAEFARQSFDLEQGPLLRAQLLRLQDNDHILLLTAHSIIFDTDSLHFLLLHWTAGYEAAVMGKSLTPINFATPYQAFVTAQPDSTASFAYWSKYLAGAPFALDLPADRARPAVQAFKSAARPFDLTPELSAALHEYADQHNVALSTLLLAAFFALVYRYTGQEDILIGTYTRAAQFDTLVGPFADLTVQRADLSAKPAFLALAQRLEAASKETQQNAALSFAKLLEMLKPERDLSRHPLVQVMFRYDEHPINTLDFGALRLEPFAMHNASGFFDLSLTMRQTKTNLAGVFEYNPDLFDSWRIDNAVGHLQTLLQGIVTNGEQPLTHLPLLTDKERQQVIVDWNATDKVYEHNIFVYRLFEMQAEKRPQATAAVDPSTQVTYAELNRRANRLAHYLVEQGIGPDTLVALLADRSVDYLTALLAVHKAGGAFLPMDTRHPAQRLAQVLEQSETPLVLTETAYSEVLQQAQSQMSANPPKLALIKDILAEKRDASNLPDRCQPHHLAYVMFTSGSTGTPKGVMVEHRGMINHNYAKIKDTEMDEHTVLAQNGPQSFDIMVWQFVAPLIVGAQVHIFSDEVAYNPIALLDEIERAGITVLQIVPALLTAMAQEAAQRGAARPALAKLRWVVPTGEALPTELCRTWLKLYPRIPLLNTYGSTECSDDQCHIAIRSVAADYPMPIMTIGTPIPNMRLYVLDAYLQPVPVGVIGELYVGGIGVGRGYLKDEARTNKAFIPDPFTPGMRLYKTADRGRFWPDGTIEFLGRVDHMVKLRGFRIELGEIESVLAQHPDIQKVVVIVREDSPGNQRLVAYLVAEKPPHSNDLRAYLRERLPEYMLPAAFIFLADIPLTSNGKVDRKALPAPERSAAELEESYIAPRSPTEKVIAEIWQEVLGLPRVGVYDNFFELGGHSLIAVRVFAQIEKRFDKRLPLASLFRAPTVEALASLVTVAEIEEVTTLSPLVEIQTKGSKPPFFCVGGGVLDLNHLSRQLGDDQPFYALHWQGLSAHQTMSASVDIVAEAFITEMKRIQPQGPYYIGGCFASGLVALEMARRLHLRGEKIALLTAIATVPRFRSTIQRAQGKFKKVLLGGPAKWWDTVSTLVETNLLNGEFTETAQRWFWKAAVRFSRLTGRPLPFRLRTGIYEEFAVRRATDRFVAPEKYTGQVALFLPPGWYEAFSSRPKWGWGDVLTDAPTVYQIPGDPCTVFIPQNVPVLGQQLKQLLTDAQAAHK